MKEQEERQTRRKAIRLLAAGKTVEAVLAKVGRSRAWLNKWKGRYERHGASGLRSQSRSPRHKARAWPQAMHKMVVMTRGRLARAGAGLKGARAIWVELKAVLKGQAVPSVRTIGRMLKDAGVAGQASDAMSAYRPHPCRELCGAMDGMDWTCRYLKGGEKVYAFHTLDLHTSMLTQTLSHDKSYATLREHALKGWKTLGIPHFLQMDNDAIFCGGYKVQRVFGQFTRLCLWMHIQPIFLPFEEPDFNFQVERVNGLWGGNAFWLRHTFGSLAQVCRTNYYFQQWFAHRYTPPALNGLTPVQAAALAPARSILPDTLVIPDPLPICPGCVHFIRRVLPDGSIRILNEFWPVRTRLAGHYVWATVQPHLALLDIWHRHSLSADWQLIKHIPYPLNEPIATSPLPNPF